MAKLSRRATIWLRSSATGPPWGWRSSGVSACRPRPPAHRGDGAQPIVQLGGVADDDDRERAPVDGPGGRVPGAERGDAREPLAVAPDVVASQAEQLGRRDGRCDLLRRLDGEREGPTRKFCAFLSSESGIASVRSRSSWWSSSARALSVTAVRPSKEACQLPIPRCGRGGVGAVGPALPLPEDEEQPRVGAAPSTCSATRAG